MKREEIKEKAKEMNIGYAEIARACVVHLATLRKYLIEDNRCLSQEKKKQIEKKADIFFAHRRWQCRNCGNISSSKGACLECGHTEWDFHWLKEGDQNETIESS